MFHLKETMRYYLYPEETKEEEECRGKWLVREYPHVMPRGRIGKAIQYTYEIYHRLTRYHLDGRYRIDNNMAENSIRPLALGRTNYLFCGNHDAAENAAVRVNCRFRTRRQC